MSISCAVSVYESHLFLVHFFATLGMTLNMFSKQAYRNIRVLTGYSLFHMSRGDGENKRDLQEADKTSA